MCYGYSWDFRRDVRKDATREPEEHPEPRADAKDPEFRAFPRRSREFTPEEPEAAPVDRLRERV